MFLWNGIQCFPVIFLAASQTAPVMCYLYCIVSVYCIFAVNEVYQIKFPATVKKIDISIDLIFASQSIPPLHVHI